MGANHNPGDTFKINLKVVSNVPKILKWEQITTQGERAKVYSRCFQCSKDTKMGANHNEPSPLHDFMFVVSNVPKILKWEQITTIFLYY